MSSNIIESIHKKINLVEFLTKNIVQIRELCKRVWFEVLKENSNNDLDRVFRNIDASFQKTLMDEKYINLLLTEIEKEISELDCVFKAEYILMIHEKKMSVVNRLQESYFKYKED